MKCSMEIALLSFISICSGVTFNLSNSEIAAIGSVAFTGQCLGSFFWGPIGNLLIMLSLVTGFDTILT